MSTCMLLGMTFSFSIAAALVLVEERHTFYFVGETVHLSFIYCDFVVRN